MRGAAGCDAGPWGGTGRAGEGVCFQPPASLLAGGLATEPESFFALDVLRQRLHEKIQEARGQVGRGDLWVPGVACLPQW